jgi:phenylacetate-coenzyme A ligase PaaK-like adenylate-forming protein
MSPDFSRPETRRAWTRRLLAGPDENRWEEMARALFAWQFARVPAYRRLCAGHGVTPRTLKSWRDIPAAPQQLFKRTRIFAHGSRQPKVVYETSGTTTGEPGRQFLWRADIYKAVALAGARHAGFFDDDAEFHFLTPPPAAATHSSLSAMFGFWARSAHRGGIFHVKRDAFDFGRLRIELEKAMRARRPVALCGTAFSFVFLLEAWASQPLLRLPVGSRVLETGGFKGRTAEISKPELYAKISRLLGVSDHAIWNEYGMSELSSQAYARGTHGIHHPPPWTRVLVCDPATGREVAPGRRGLVRWYDLANVDSVFALQTLDLAERTPEGFRLIGRLPRTEPRGCSLGAEDLVVAKERRS